MLELGDPGHLAVPVVVPRGPGAWARQVWWVSEHALERESLPRMRGKACEADVVEQDVLGIDQASTGFVREN